MIESRGKKANVIALYSKRNPQDKLDFKCCLLKLRDLVKVKYSLSLNYVGIDGEKYPDKVVKFEKVKKKLSSDQFENVNNISLYSSLESYNSPNYDWIIFIGVFYSDLGNELVFCIDEKIIDFHSKLFKDLFLELLALGEFSYGIGFQRDYSKGPEYYPSGIISGEIPDDEETCISKWANDRFDDNLIEDGYLRDIYPYNLLNLKQLKKDFGGDSLENFIVKRELGSILHVSDGFKIWSLSNKEMQEIERLDELKANLIAYL